MFPEKNESFSLLFAHKWLSSDYTLFFFFLYHFLSLFEVSVLHHCEDVVQMLSFWSSGQMMDYLQ